jgi:hypothetical protein
MYGPSSGEGPLNGGTVFSSAITPGSALIETVPLAVFS